MTDLVSTMLRTVITLTTLLTLTNSFSLSRLFGISEKIEDKSLSEVNTQWSYRAEPSVVRKCLFQTSCNSVSSGAGQCFFDLTCRLSYGQKVGGDCDSWHQVCCVFPDQLQAFHRQQRLLQYSADRQQVTVTVTQ